MAPIQPNEEVIYKADLKHGKRATIKQVAGFNKTSVEVKLMVQISEMRRQNQEGNESTFEAREATGRAIDSAVSDLLKLKNEVVNQVIDHTGVFKKSKLQRSLSFNNGPPKDSGKKNQKKSQTFGNSTASFLASKKPDAAQTVIFFQDAFKAFFGNNSEWVKTEGIYRLSAESDLLSKAHIKFLSGETYTQIMDELDPQKKNPILSACLIKKILSQSFVLIPYEDYKKYLSNVNSTNEPEVMRAMQKVYNNLDPNRKILLIALFKHLERVDAYSKKTDNYNKMSASNLAIVFAPVITRFSEGEASDQLAENTKTTEILRICIEKTDRKEKVHWLETNVE
ncbi:MAG: hypothetical protein JJU12_06575 [Chlamydiales bacterium]|nr:hypothetical protein [Chlamydiales bacterium]